ncbi:hypothetical protein D9757_007992 [Collybiopsis confluens]|uniref:Uncharacterized protein n=1 Tax=Collybiopsis confluens TaxID=2823264 RepID=A0A8H5M1M4_9AGAR|nr:hypothetical protein D9757_007992 [Collybiopsis confluens]
MKIYSFMLLAGAGLLQVNASPLRLVFVESKGSLSPLSGSNNENVAQVQPQVIKFAQHNSEQGTRRGCGGARFRQKTVEMSNTLRQALGMPLIQTELVYSHFGGSKEAHSGLVHVLPYPLTASDESEATGSHSRHNHHHRPHNPGFIRQSATFMKRVHLALMTLGPWEGRAVAFVLGCGLGVLLRMLWVLTVVSYRTIRGTEDEDEDEEIAYIPVFNQQDAEEIFVAPPVYILDEKAPLKEEMKAAEEAN